MEINKHASTKLLSTDKGNNHQQSSMIPNYHNNHLDYRNGSQMSFYDDQQQQFDDEPHRQQYFLASDRQKTDTMHSGSDGSTKSEQQIPNIYHQQNGFLMKAKKQLANNNECDGGDDHVLLQRNKKTNQYGKILNYNRTAKDHRNGSRPIPMLPSPPSTPPPPLNAKIKDYHDSSNKFYQEYQSSVHHQNRFNANNGNVNNNNEVRLLLFLFFFFIFRLFR